MTKKNSQSPKGGFKTNLIQQIITIFDKNPTKSFNYKQLSTAFGFKDISNKKLVNIILEELADQGKLKETKRGTFKLKNSKSFVGYVADGFDLLFMLFPLLI